tara:strand:+ start:426 stop:530 length:105 start_codon:yes stop_codon:yes gene_type:complete
MTFADIFAALLAIFGIVTAAGVAKQLRRRRAGQG